MDITYSIESSINKLIEWKESDFHNGDIANIKRGGVSAYKILAKLNFNISNDKYVDASEFIALMIAHGVKHSNESTSSKFLLALNEQRVDALIKSNNIIPKLKKVIPMIVRSEYNTINLVSLYFDIANWDDKNKRNHTIRQWMVQNYSNLK